MDLGAFLNTHASAVFALTGALGGSVISLIGAWIMQKQKYSLSLWDKISERRIKAHEDLLHTAMELRMMIAFGGVDEAGEVLRAPRILMSKDLFISSFEEISQRSVSGASWQTTEAKRASSYVQDYFVTLHQTLQFVLPELYPNVGVILRQDFSNLSSQLEKSVMKYFAKDIRKLRATSVYQWHKYPLAKTIQGLANTELLKHQEAIMDQTHPGMAEPIFSERIQTIPSGTE